MKVIEAVPLSGVQITTDDEFNPIFTRYSKESWTIRMGESDEPVYDNEKINELEKAYQTFLKFKKPLE